MAKLYFRYSTMGAGKSLDLIKVAKNYEERDKKVLVLKPATDTYSKNIHTRAGIEYPATVITDADNLYGLTARSMPDCVLVDEAQFMLSIQVDQLAFVADKLDIPVICYGLRLSYMGETFPGSARLLAIADTIEELKTICSHSECKKKATHVLLLIGDEVIKNGKQVIIRDETTDYRPLCRKHWRRAFYG